MGPIVVAGQHAGAAATTKALTLSAQASTTTAAATATIVAVSSATSTYGEQVALTATVTTSGTGTLGGKVQFYDGSVAIGMVRLNGSGVATLDLKNLSVRCPTDYRHVLRQRELQHKHFRHPGGPDHRRREHLCPG